MGLDMYLYRLDRPASPYISQDLASIEKDDPTLYKRLKPHIKTNYIPGGFSFQSLFDKVGYWEGAIQIHEWFLRNLSNGKKRSSYYIVSEELLWKLYWICLAVLQKSKTVKGEIVLGKKTHLPCGREVLIKKNASIIENPEIARELLPCKEETYQGATVYDSEYLTDVSKTVCIIGNALFQTDFDNEAVCYHWC